MRPVTTNPRFFHWPSVLIWMGEASCGRSPTSPTFFTSTSVRTQMELQYSHTACTLLRKLYVTGAPQLGQLTVTLLIGGLLSRMRKLFERKLLPILLRCRC